MSFVASKIRPVSLADAASIAEIYAPYIRDTVITFEEEPVSPEEMLQRIEKVTKDFPWLVLEENDVVIGYAYGSTWRSRPAYRFAAETTIYLSSAQTGKGFGLALYKALIAELRVRDFHSAIGCLALPNEPSVRLHEKLGFRKVGHFTEAGWKFNRWIDVGFWELMI